MIRAAMPATETASEKHGRRASRWTLALALVCLLGAGGLARAAEIPVQTDKGVVIGTSDRGVAAFLGIPYAAPPAGSLRFRSPQPHGPWSAPLTTSAYGSPCPQSARLGSPSLNEDCLFLNVWAPLLPGGRKPVMLFIHGGSFNSGNGGANPGGTDFGGPDIARQADVVVVTINYRLSVLGFLAAPALDAENPNHVSGNYGLQDQQAALAWVRRNIGRFGGDPANVTIFGQSAGGGSVIYQLTSPGATGLFSRAIVQSAGDSPAPPLAAAEQSGASVIAGLGCGGTADVSACLRALPVETIINSGLRAGPTIDGATLPQQPRDAFTSGQFNRVPTMIGTTADEGTYFIALATLAKGRALTPADYAAAIAANFPNAVAPIEAAYPLSAYNTPADALAALSRDSAFACPSELVRSILAPQVRTWGYEFTEPNPALNVPLPAAPGVDLGDSHTTELAYVFGHDGFGKPLNGRDLLLSHEVIAYWTRFAASGDPNYALRLAALPELRYLRAIWPRYQARQPLLLSIKNPPAPITAFNDRHHCALWASLGYPERLIVSVP